MLRNEKNVTPIHPGVRIGHVHLKVADLERALGFYCGVLGFEFVMSYGKQAAFISAGGYHHHIGLNTWESPGGSPPPAGHTGLYHFAILYPDRKELADALRRLQEAGVPLEGASDHGVSEALYLRDPGWERAGVVLGPSEGGMAKRWAGESDDVHEAAGPGGAGPERGGMILDLLAPKLMPEDLPPLQLSARETQVCWQVTAETWQSGQKKA